MSSKIFATKKMDVKKPNWVRRSIIATTAMAILGAFGFGVYQAANTTSLSSTETRSERPTSKNHHAAVPVYASKAQSSKRLAQKSVITKKAKKTKKQLANKKKSGMKKVAMKGKGSKSYKADLSKLNPKSKKHVAKSKKTKRSAKQLASK